MVPAANIGEIMTYLSRWDFSVGLFGGTFFIFSIFKELHYIIVLFILVGWY